MKIHKSQQMRLDRIEEVFKGILEKQPLLIGQIMALFSQTSRQTLQDYVRILENSKRITKDEFGRFITTK